VTYRLNYTRTKFIKKKALKVLGFIRHNTWKFKNSICIKVLYCSLVRSILEYCSVVWNHLDTGIWVNKLESVQNRFLKFLATKLKLSYYNDLYKFITLLNSVVLIHYLKADYWIMLIIYTFKLIIYQINCPDLLTKIKFKSPTFIFRNNLLFHIDFHRQNYSYYSPWNRKWILCSVITLQNLIYFQIHRDN